MTIFGSGDLPPARIEKWREPTDEPRLVTAEPVLVVVGSTA